MYQASTAQSNSASDLVDDETKISEFQMRELQCKLISNPTLKFDGYKQLERIHGHVDAYETQ